MPAEQPAAEPNAFDESGAGTFRGGTSSGSVRKLTPTRWDVWRPKGTLKFCQLWWKSRPVTWLGAALPFVVVSVAASAYVVSLRTTSPYAAVPQFERALRDAIEDERIDDALILMKGLAELAPNEPRHKYNRALLMIEHESRETGLAQMLALAPREGSGYAPARMWLVRQAQSEEPLVPLTPDEVLFQLQQVAKQTPQDQTAHEMLSQMYLARNELWLAETHLADAARGVPELNLLLARVQRQLGRDESAVAATLERARTHFQGRLASFPSDATARVGWAQCLQLEGKLNEAEALLREGLANQSSKILRIGLSQYYSDVAALKLRESAQNMPFAADLVASALRENPENAAAIELLARLYQSQAPFNAAALQPALDAYRKLADSGALEPGPALGYAATLGAVGRPADGARVLAEPNDSPVRRRVLLQLLRDAGEAAATERLARELLQTSAERIAAAPDDVDAAIEHAANQAASGQYDAALQTLKTFQEQAATPIAQQPLLFREIYAATCLSLYDQRRAESTGDADWELLRDVLTTNCQTDPAITRLAALTYAKLPSSAAAEQFLQRLAAMGRNSWIIYGYLGGYAQEAGDYERARRYLERAHAAQPNDPILKNNLASALIQRSTDEAERALSLVNEALERLPQHPSLLTTRAEIYAATDRWEEACQDLVAILPVRGANAAHHRKLEQAYAQLGEIEMSAEHRELAIALEQAADAEPSQNK